MPALTPDITKPMDLQTVLRNVKNHKYKNKTDFGNDIDLIWQNCLTYNTTAVGARALAELMAEPPATCSSAILAPEEQPLAVVPGRPRFEREQPARAVVGGVRRVSRSAKSCIATTRER